MNTITGVITGLAPVCFWINRFNSTRTCSFRSDSSDSVCRDAPAIAAVTRRFTSLSIVAPPLNPLSALNPRTPRATIFGSPSSSPVSSSTVTTTVSVLLALAHSLAADLFESALIYERAANLTLVDDRGPLAVKLEHVAILDQNDVLFRVAEMVFDELLVPEKHPVFAVNRHDKLRTHSFRHDPDVFLRSMPADVDQPAFLFDDVRATLVDESDHARDQTLVARNDARRQHDRVAFFDHQPFVTLHRHLRERRARLALRSSDEKNDLVIAHRLRFVQ